MSGVWAIGGVLIIAAIVYDVTKSGSQGSAEIAGGGKTIVGIFNDVTGK